MTISLHERQQAAEGNLRYAVYDPVMRYIAIEPSAAKRLGRLARRSADPAARKLVEEAYGLDPWANFSTARLLTEVIAEGVAKSDDPQDMARLMGIREDLSDAMHALGAAAMGWFREASEVPFVLTGPDSAQIIYDTYSALPYDIPETPTEAPLLGAA